MEKAVPINELFGKGLDRLLDKDFMHVMKDFFEN